ncbi:hydroxyisourate hydrolase [Kiloniella sp.]|uniref:hydroxyisourate hydrolase n=1 Tax=Kiloniella sp. TaxID=1938587 RepID=UPI003B01C857
MGRLTTHVLDTASGLPAKDLTIELWQFEGDKSVLVKSVTTNDDGRVGRPILDDNEFSTGEYELRFMAGNYLKQQSHDLPDPLFLNIIPIRFGIADATAHYHVPLLLSPFGYSTYRGS